MSISLCMIVKNEENNIRRCLDSVRDVADEMIIVDTGSTDSTVEIAKSYGASVYFFPWNGSFSDARNHALKQATCDWVLIMDADDELPPESKPELLQLAQTGDADAYFMETISFMGEKPGADVLKNMNMRLMRNFKGYFFSLPIHEQIFCNIKAVNPNAKIVNLPIKFYHYGYLLRNVIGHDKRKRNIGLLEKELADHPDSPFTLFNLGSEYFALGDNTRAIECFERSYEKFVPTEGFSPHLLLKMAHCYNALHRYDESLAICKAGLKHYPMFTDLEYLRGVIRMGQAKPHAAAEHFRRCIQMGEPPNPFNVIVGTGSFRAQCTLGQIYFDCEDYETALELLTSSLEHSADFPAPFPLYVRCLCRLKLPDDLVCCRLDELFARQKTLLSLGAVDLLIEEKSYEAALHVLTLLDNEPANRLRIGICRFYQTQYDAAFALFGGLTKTLIAVDALLWQALCCVSMGKFPKAKKLALQAQKKEPGSTVAPVYLALCDLLGSSSSPVLAEEEAKGEPYLPGIFGILRALLRTQQFDRFEASLSLLNTVSDKTVLLRLAKLYFDEGFDRLACNELLRSIKLFDLIDTEGAHMLATLKMRGY